MPPRKDPNAHSNADRSSNSSGGFNGTSNSSPAPSTTTNTAITISSSTTTASITPTSLPTTQTTQATTSTSSNVTATAAAAATNTITIPAASIANTRSSSSALAAAAAAAAASVFVGGATVTAAGIEINKSAPATSSAADTAAEQRTMAFQANAKLCRLVRKCPWMYDRNHHNYAKKHILDKSWVKIARECNDSVPSCKERWRNIRAAFARSINIYKTHSGPNRVKPYYLHKELSFLVKPMMEGRDKNDDTQDNAENVAKDEYTEGEEDDDEHDIAEESQPPEEEEDFHDDAADIKSAFEALNPDINLHSEAKFHKMLKNLNNAILNSTRTQSHSTEFENSTGNLFEPSAEFSASDAENEFHYPGDDAMSQVEVDRKSVNMLNHGTALKRPINLDADVFEAKRLKLSQIAPSAAEADIRFLEALLPDMALMNTRQKIVFKRKIYQTLEEVFENSNDFPNINSNSEQQQQQQQQNNMSQTMITASSLGHHQMPSNIGGIGGGMVNLNNSLPNQVKQTVLTVNSSTARSLINNIANLSETDLQRVHGFLQSNMRASLNNCNTGSGNTSNGSNHSNMTTTHHQNSPGARLANGVPNVPCSAAARLMHSTPKITITKVTCPPPASLRNIAMNKPPSPSIATVSTTIHHTPGPIMTSNVVHSTTSSTTTAANPTSIGTNLNTTGGSNAHNATVNNPWNQIVPIAIKDEVEDVDID